MLKRLFFILILMSFFLLHASDGDVATTVKKEVCPTATENMSKKEKRDIKNCVQRNDPNRLEWAILPVIAFDSDIGFIFGGNVVTFEAAAVHAASAGGHSSLQHQVHALA